MIISNLKLESRTPGIGIALYYDEKYVATYTSLNDCILDLIYNFSVTELDELFAQFKYNTNVNLLSPYKYRGVCSELFDPTDIINRYIVYSNSLGDLLEKIEKHEQRSLKSDHFLFGIQGMGIHIFNEETQKYEFWIGNNSFKSVSEIIKEAHDKKIFVPDEAVQEYMEESDYDVFISHKSEDVKICKQLYDFLTSKHLKVFLSEISLPAIANSDYSYEIDTAIEKSKNMIVVMSTYENIMSGWVKYEWTTFANEIRSGRKNGNIVSISYPDLSIDKLPLLLRQFEIIPVDEYENVYQFLKG